MKIFKYPLLDGDNFIEMPVAARILTVQTQDEIPCIWAIVNDEEKTMEYRRFLIFPTGQNLPPALEASPYVGTFQLSNGTFVFHVFEHYYIKENLACTN